MRAWLPYDADSREADHSPSPCSAWSFGSQGLPRPIAGVPIGARHLPVFQGISKRIYYSISPVKGISSKISKNSFPPTRLLTPRFPCPIIACEVLRSVLVGRGPRPAPDLAAHMTSNDICSALSAWTARVNHAPTRSVILGIACGSTGGRSEGVNIKCTMQGRRRALLAVLGAGGAVPWCRRPRPRAGRAYGTICSRCPGND